MLIFKKLSKSLTEKKAKRDKTTNKSTKDKSDMWAYPSYVHEQNFISININFNNWENNSLTTTVISCPPLSV